MRAELEYATANAVAGQYAPPGSKTVRLQLERAAGDGPAAFHHHLVGLAFNALAHAMHSGNAPAVQAAALAVAAAAVRLVAHQGDGNNGNNGRAA